jgi:hypothetical protein
MKPESDEPIKKTPNLEDKNVKRIDPQGHPDKI